MPFQLAKPTADADLLQAHIELTDAYERFAALLRERHPSLIADFGAASGGLFQGLNFVDDMLADVSRDN